MTRICFVDTEPTGLRHDRRAWDIAVIVRDEDAADVACQWFVDYDDLDLGNADLYGLRVGHFYERHPGLNDIADGWTMPEAQVLAAVEELTRGAHLVGAVPNFDAEVLATRMRANGICPSWNYHLLDAETLAVGYLAAKGVAVPLPWKSDDLSRLIGVEPPSGQDRHTALGDARWAMAMYDAVTAGAAA